MSAHLEQLKLRFLTEFSSFRVFPIGLFHPQLNSFNPSIAIHNGEIYFSLRHSNMLAAGNMRHYRTFNKSIMWNATHPIDETSFGTLRMHGRRDMIDYTLFDDRLTGFQDLRIFCHHGRWHALGTRMIGDVVSGAGNIMHLFSFNDRFQLERSVALPSPTGSHTEKSWVPLCKGDALFIVYRPAPLDVFLLDLDAKRMTPMVRGKQPAADCSLDNTSQWTGLAGIPWSGSSQFVPYDTESYIGVVHRKFIFADELIYEHAFMKVGPDFEFALSRPFHFFTFGIEMCIGAALLGHELLISFGSHNDTRAYLCAIAQRDVESLFLV